MSSGALTDPATLKQYWFGMHQETDWLPGVLALTHCQSERWVGTLALPRMTALFETSDGDRIVLRRTY